MGATLPASPARPSTSTRLASWRPDGRKIAFVSDRPTATNTEGDSEIYVMNADGSNQTQITFNALNELFPAWSPDGRAIVFVRDLDPDRGDDVNDDDLFTMDADGTDQRNRTNTPGAGETEPAWSPHGRQIAFVSDRDGDPEIYTMHPRGSDVRQLTVNAHNDFSPHWSPEGRRIAFDADPLDLRDVFTMRADGTDKTRLTFNPALDVFPVWSPDGRHLAFASNRDGSADIFTMRADGSAQVNRTRNPAFDFAPAWQPLRDHHH